MIIFKIWCHPTDRRKREEYKENDFFKDELPYLVTREYLETFLYWVYGLSISTHVALSLSIDWIK